MYIRIYIYIYSYIIYICRHDAYSIIQIIAGQNPDLLFLRSWDQRSVSRHSHDIGQLFMLLGYPVRYPMRYTMIYTMMCTYIHIYIYDIHIYICIYIYI